MLKRILEVPKQNFFLLGPRGSGKSTWLRSVFPDAYVIDLLSDETYQRLLSNPGQFADQMRTIPAGHWVIVDEVQRLPELLNEVHRFIEEKGIRFILCGSSARKLKGAGINLLAGRALRRSMFYPSNDLQRNCLQVRSESWGSREPTSILTHSVYPFMLLHRRSGFYSIKQNQVKREGEQNAEKRGEEKGRREI